MSAVHPSNGRIPIRQSSVSNSEDRVKVEMEESDMEEVNDEDARTDEGHEDSAYAEDTSVPSTVENISRVNIRLCMAVTRHHVSLSGGFTIRLWHNGAYTNKDRRRKENINLEYLYTN
jgi:hypothetical protein